MRQAIIFGAGGHGRVIADIISRSQSHKILGFLDDNLKKGTRIGASHEVLGTRNEAPSFCDKNTELFVAVGDNWARSRVVAYFKEVSPNIEFGTAIHPSAQLGSEVTIRMGVCIMAGAVVNIGSKIGEFCIINSSASIDHDCSIGSFSSILPGAVLGGNVQVGEFSVIALGANIIHQIKIGDHSIVGAGATVVTDIPSYVTAYGTPARIKNIREPGDKYL